MSSVKSGGKRKTQPTIIGANHLANTIFGWEHSKEPENLQECIKSAKTVSNILESLAHQSVQRTLFIEGTKRSLRNEKVDIYNDPNKPLFEISSKNEPFLAAVQTAKKNGWKIVPLDSRIKRATSEFGFFGTTESRLFHNMNVREDAWVDGVLKKEAKPKDVILIHSGHVRGILLKTGWKGKQVIWVNRPDKFKLERRLNSRRRRALRRYIEAELGRRGSGKKEMTVFSDPAFGGKILKRLVKK